MPLYNLIKMIRNNEVNLPFSLPILLISEKSNLLSENHPKTGYFSGCRHFILKKTLAERCRGVFRGWGRLPPYVTIGRDAVPRPK